MNNQAQHEMVLETTHPSGAEGWYCPTCGRRTLINWEPKFKRIVLEAGDDHAIHKASKGGAQIGPLQIEPQDTADAPSSTETGQSTGDDHRLAPWSAWLDESDFEDLWNDESQ